MNGKKFEEYSPELKGAWGGVVIVLDEVDSTNKYMIENDFPAGTVVTCIQQKAGRGRSGRSWVSKAGDSITFTIALPQMHPKMLTGAQIVAGFAVIDAFLPYADLRLKWPNDAVCNGKKFGGLLIETRFSGSELKKAVLGIGVNILKVPEGLEDKAISLKECGEGFPGATVLLDEMICALEEKFTDYLEGYINLSEEWPLYSANFMKMVSFHRDGTKFQAKELGITSDGLLIVENSAGTAETVSVGEIGYDFGF